MNGGWPAPPQQDDSGQSEGIAEPTTSETTGTEATPAEAIPVEGTAEDIPNPWLAVTWPAPPGPTAAAAPEPVAEEIATDAEVEVATVVLPVAEGARERAGKLLDELRNAIAAIDGEAPRDLAGVISELEVAVTPPGAIGHDDLNELREALLRARERPRDLDTIVDLTGRIDALVTLVIAYDRTIAAIERSLEALKGEEGG